MAQRQGLLIGRHLSPVQFKGTIILDYMERMESSKGVTESNLRRLKEALVASGSWKPEGLFPEHFKDEIEDKPEAPIPEGVSVDYSAVDWRSPSDANNAEDEYRALMAQVAGAQNGSFSGDAMALPGEGWR